MPVKGTADLCAWLVLCSLGWAVPPCSSNIQALKLNRAGYRQIQRYVNQGHQPWRLDSNAVAGVVILDLTHAKDRTSAYDVPLVEVSETERRAIYLYRLKGSSYYITLERFDWLLPVAKRWESMIWVPTHTTILTCQADNSQSR